MADADAELTETANVVADKALTLVLVEEGTGALLVGLPGGQHLIDEQQEGVGDGHDSGRFDVFLGGQPPKPLFQEAPVGGCRRPSGLS